ncbi:hypothetical protein AMATHDRAFT_54686 [Amanita thiersii Skay4041]|uniref:C2 domain-containing protein n=1 Tax=Amanita thiersii Skay4041 TaxID=703135 RepID=A0A2A9NZJ5_9AGAR|nr:hypothetical protein AMATHDRAFT_54686 [Amanita thiersii Skay4041]
MPSSLNLSRMFTQLNDIVQSSRSDALTRSRSVQHSYNDPYLDVEIQFIGASGLPKMDVVGTADPYFIAKLDRKVSFVSTVKRNTLTPVWNELWRIKNVPSSAELHVEVLDKDEGSLTNDFIGSFRTSISTGAKEVEIEGLLFKRTKGTFWLSIKSTPSTDLPERQQAYPYFFDGPIRFSQHLSPTVGRLTNLKSAPSAPMNSILSDPSPYTDSRARLYSTWKLYLKGVSLFFHDIHQPWNHEYKAAQNIFGPGPACLAVRSGIQAGHRMLYARTANNGFGIVEGAQDFFSLLRGGPDSKSDRNARQTSMDAGNTQQQRQHLHRIKPAVYTYIISSEDDSFRFSETGAAFFVDFASKHALHANCANSVRYSGEFHPRPKGGWEFFSESMADSEVEWEIVIDNNSGTYAPDVAMLPALKELLEFNFPGLGVIGLDRENPTLVESREGCRNYAVTIRGVRAEELQPRLGEGEETLMHHVNEGK